MTTRRAFLASVPLMALAVSLRPAKSAPCAHRAEETLRRRSSPWWQTRGDIEFSGSAWMDEAAFRDRLMRDYLAGEDQGINALWVGVRGPLVRPSALTFGIAA